MRRGILSILAFLVLSSAALLGWSARAHAGVGNFCPFGGPCNFSDATIVNVYWDTSVAAWNSDVGGAGSGLTQAQIDAFTAGIIHSTYFSQLKQYGVNSVSVAPSVTTGNCGTVPANVDAAINDIDALILCALTHAQVTASPQTIINVFLPPQVVNTGFCNPDSSGAHAAAMHSASATFASPLYTIIPTTPACLAGATATFTALTHEMDEALTDPDAGSLSGWKVIADGEIGDLCQNTMTFPVSPYANGSAQQYWSNSAGACVVGFTFSPAPSVTSSSVCGTGQSMTVTLNGTFGPTPWDLLSNAFAGQSLYLSAIVSRPGSTASPWSINFLGLPPTVGFQKVAWTPGTGPGGSDQIKTTGFDGAYGAPAFTLQAGDKILFTITNPANGSLTTVLVTAPSPAQINLSAAPDIQAGATGNITLTAIDSSGCAVENAPVTLTNSLGTAMPALTSGPGGYRSIGFVYPSVGESITFTASTPGSGGVVSASTTTRVHPRLDSLVPARGDVAGGRTAVLTGLGFDGTTTVTFGGNAATIQSVTPDHKTVTLTTPAATPAGTTGAVSVSAAVHGISGGNLQYDYISPDAPVMEFLGGAGSSTASHSCETGRIRVSAFDANGALEATTISLRATYPAIFVGKHLVMSALVASGSIVTISGGGPITATSLHGLRPSLTESFPVWPADLCEGIKIINAKISRLAAGSAIQFKPSQPACAGDCGGPGVQTVIWGSAETAARAQSLVWMQGADAALLKQTYEVQSLDENAQRKVAAQYPAIAVRSKTAQAAAFIGPMIEIRARTDQSETTKLPASTRLTLTAPVAAAAGTYAIVHLRSAGGTQAWLEEQPTTTDRHGTVLATTADYPGIYALVRLTTQVTKAVDAGKKTSRAR